MAFQFGDDTFYLIMNEPVDLDENLETDEEESSFDSDEDEEDEDEIIERILLRRFQQNRFENINGYEADYESDESEFEYDSSDDEFDFDDDLEDFEIDF
ncbi:unnamed protein product [Caenorhabditis bovis]|uniref:Uncharacterized protein n=1 Tax=Caenorhabditis bovis TaxID=2654633 RepID=A0A8S1EP16_9PELO|nr:unnamed protein product [Caenorhabditis bovis]